MVELTEDRLGRGDYPWACEGPAFLQGWTDCVYRAKTQRQRHASAQYTDVPSRSPGCFTLGSGWSVV